VAATRAKNLLVISSLNHKSNKSIPWHPLLKNITEEMNISVPEAGLPERETKEKEK